MKVSDSSTTSPIKFAETSTTSTTNKSDHSQPSHSRNEVVVVAESLTEAESSFNNSNASVKFKTNRIQPRTTSFNNKNSFKCEPKTRNLNGSITSTSTKTSTLSGSAFGKSVNSRRLKWMSTVESSLSTESEPKEMKEEGCIKPQVKYYLYVFVLANR